MLFSSVQSFSGIRLFRTPWATARQASLSHRQLLEFTQTYVHWVSDAIQPVILYHAILCCLHLLLPSIFPSIRIFSNESVLHIKWPKYWSFSFNISPSNEHPGLISLRMDWLDLLAVQGTLKSLLQHHSSKASIFRCSALFTVQLSHPYMSTGKTIALTRWTFVGIFKIMCRFIIDWKGSTEVKNSQYWWSACPQTQFWSTLPVFLHSVLKTTLQVGGEVSPILKKILRLWEFQELLKLLQK